MEHHMELEVTHNNKCLQVYFTKCFFKGKVNRALQLGKMRVKDNTGMAVPLLKTGKTVLRTRRHREL
jgi:hypothetical protein